MIYFSLMTLEYIHRKYIRYTGEKALIQKKVFFLCSLYSSVKNECLISNKSVSLSTVMLKHLYDKKPAEEYDKILLCIKDSVRHPEEIYKNKENKTGGFCFVKSFLNQKYFTVLQESHAEQTNYIVTSFRIRKEQYLKGYEKIWERESDNLHRNTK